MELQEIHKEILALCVDDDTGLWLIARRTGLKFSVDIASLVVEPQWVKERTIDVIRDLLESELVVAGNPNGSKFQPLYPSVLQTIEFIEKEWKNLGRTISLGDICWFRATPAGEQLACELNLI